MNWRGLLVSVRDAAEAAEAIAGGADIVDVKEPRHGSLGAAEPHVVAAVADVVGGRRPWTMACGELAPVGGDVRGHAPAALDDRVRRILRLLSRSASPPAAVKVGLAGMSSRPWREELAAAFAPLPRGLQRVAVAYADWRRAASPSPPEVIAVAGAIGCTAVLIDTFDKAGPGLFGSCLPGEIASWVKAAHRGGLAVAVAGRLAVAEIPAAWGLLPEVVALRSAVCFNGRDGTVRADLVARAVSLAPRSGGTEGDARSRHRNEPPA